jgi:hypothetical protein
MKKRYLFLIILLLVCNSQAQQEDSLSSDILLRTFIQSDNVPLNREVVYHVELRWKGDLNQYQIKEIQEPALTNLTTRGSGSSNKVNTLSDGSIQSVKRITFYLTPIEMGMAYIDGLQIKYTDVDQAQDGSLISSRIGVKIIEPLPEPGASPWTSIIVWSMVVLMIGGLVLYFYSRYQKQKEAQRLRAAEDIHETVEEKYLRLLRETIQFESDNIRESLSDLSRLLTGYLSEKYNTSAAGSSSQDIITLLEDKNLPEETLARIKEFFPRADMVKFAAEQVDISEFHRLYDTVELVIENQAKGTTNES